MARDDVIRTYFANFSKYKHLLSVDILYIYAKHILLIIKK